MQSVRRPSLHSARGRQITLTWNRLVVRHLVLEEGPPQVLVRSGETAIGDRYADESLDSVIKLAEIGAAGVAAEKEAERWTRSFADKTFSSTQSCGSGKDEYLLVERFGAISVALALVLDGRRLYLIPRRWRFWGIPMPSFLLPTGSSFESEEENRFCFDVDISAPLVGLIGAYRGALEPAG